MEGVLKSGHCLYTIPPALRGNLKPEQPSARAYSGAPLLMALISWLERHPVIGARDPSELFFPGSRFLFRSPLQVTSRLAQAMLPRNLLSTAARSAVRRRLQVSSSHIPRIHPIGPHARNNVLSVSAAAQFHSSARRHNELPKSPFQTFVDVLKDELRKNRELAENVKQLQGDVDKFQDSEAMKKAKDAYERARVCPYPPMHYFELDFINFCYSLPPASKKTPNYVLQLKNSGKLVLK